MSEKTPVRAVAFDPDRHVIAGRQMHDGRQLFFSLASIVEAERTIEAAPAPAPIALPAPHVAGVTPEEMYALEERLLKAMQAAAPPPQFPMEIIQTLQDATAAIISLTQRVQALEDAMGAMPALIAKIERLEGDVAMHTENFAAIMKMAEGGS